MLVIYLLIQQSSVNDTNYALEMALIVEGVYNWINKFYPSLCFLYKISYAYLCHDIVKEDNKVCKRIKVGVFVMWKFLWTMCGLLRK